MPVPTAWFNLPRAGRLPAFGYEEHTGKGEKEPLKGGGTPPPCDWNTGIPPEQEEFTISEHIINTSLGKDSNAMWWLMKQNGWQIDRVLFADIPGAEFEETYQFVATVEKKMEMQIEKVRSQRWTCWDEYFYAPLTRGKNRGANRGFPPVVGMGCGINRDFKTRPLESAHGTDNIIYIGIAADEAHRTQAKQYQGGKNIYRFPLVELGVTEAECRQICEQNGILHPLYQYFKRLGCWQCPKQSLDSLRQLYRHWPEKWAKLEQYQNDCLWPFKPGRTVHDLTARFQTELDQTTMQGCIGT